MQPANWATCFLIPASSLSPPNQSLFANKSRIYSRSCDLPCSRVTTLFSTWNPSTLTGTIESPETVRALYLPNAGVTKIIFVLTKKRNIPRNCCKAPCPQRARGSDRRDHVRDNANKSSVRNLLSGERWGESRACEPAGKGKRRGGMRLRGWRNGGENKHKQGEERKQLRKRHEKSYGEDLYIGGDNSYKDQGDLSWKETRIIVRCEMWEKGQ